MAKSKNSTRNNLSALLTNISENIMVLKDQGDNVVLQLDALIALLLFLFVTPILFITLILLLTGAYYFEVEKK